MEFERNWTAEVLPQAPLIAPARQYVWPMRVAGEEEALARGAMQVMVRPGSGGAYLLSCALGFRDRSMPSAVYGCPSAEEICIVAGGYGYLAQVAMPEKVTLLGMKPVVAVMPVVEEGLLLFVGFHTVLAWGTGGMAWETGRLSWDGVRVTGFEDGVLHGFGWDMRKDVEVAFEVDLKTGLHRGGGWTG